MEPVVRHLDLFSGIGGFALACRMVGGIETVAFCEREPYCQRVLAKHWPSVPICPDIHDLKGTEYGTVELITGGYPCQPFSLAGKRKGAGDDRHLWPELRRVVETARPRWCLFENVVGHISMGLDAVLSDLDSIGYAAGPCVVPACAVDARHRRDRVWIVAHSRHGSGRDERSFENGGRFQAGRATNSDSTGGPGCESEALAYTEGIGGRTGLCEDGQKRDRNQLANGCGDVAHANGERGRLRPAFGQDAKDAGQPPCAWQDEGEWFAQSGMGRVAHGIPARVDRLRGLGNAIVPQVAAEIIRAMMQADRYTANIAVSGGGGADVH